MKKIILLGFSLALIPDNSHAQGCVAVRNISGFGQYNFTDNSFTRSDWNINITNRYFKSFRDFRGNRELKFPDDSVQFVRSFTTDITVNRLLPKGWSLALSIPVSANSRSSKTEHGGIANSRHETRSFGIGDIRWCSPIADDEYAEYRDEAFLSCLNLAPTRRPLSTFWPRGGPQWDALGVTTSGGAVLVEAKAHVNELYSPAPAASEASLGRIQLSLRECRAGLGEAPAELGS